MSLSKAEKVLGVPGITRNKKLLGIDRLQNKHSSQEPNHAGEHQGRQLVQVVSLTLQTLQALQHSKLNEANRNVANYVPETWLGVTNRPSIY